jgi:hypothetical protein
MEIEEETLKEEVNIALSQTNLQEKISLEDAVSLVKVFLLNMGVDVLE